MNVLFPGTTRTRNQVPTRKIALGRGLRFEAGEFAKLQACVNSRQWVVDQFGCHS